MKSQIKNLIKKHLPRLIELRRTIHSIPELAGMEFETSALIRKVLAETEIKLLTPFLETDVVGLLQGKNSGHSVALRADIDALPLNEMTALPYASICSGKMHACGHDGHATILLGTALVLNELRDQFEGSVRFVFQPGEEVAALGRELVAAGALENPAPRHVFALHAHPGKVTGTILSRPGAIMAAAGFFKIIITGRGGHGSQPQNTVDPIVIASQLVTALQSIVARNIDPQEAAVVSVCRFSAGNNENVIPEQALLEGTIRFLNQEVGKKLPELIKRQTEGICHANGAKYTFEYSLPYEPCINDPECVKMVQHTAVELFGKEMYQEMPRSSMGGEDFCYFLKKYPGAFFNLGVGTDSPGIHNPHFNFNDDALENGIMMMVHLALKSLGS